MDDSEGKEGVEQSENELSLKDHESGRPGRRTSKVWQVFNRMTDNNAQCSICSRILSFKSSVTNLAKHIQRKHASAFLSLCSDEDPREGLKEFITIDTGRGEVAADDGEGDDEDPIRTEDTDWFPPSKTARKSATSLKKVVKKEVISSNGVDYVIYTQDQVTRPTSSATKKTVTTPQRAMAGRTAVVSSSPVLSAPTARPQPQLQIEEDEFSTFARFLSQRIRALKNPYWQSCAINEINSALHRIEMRRYEMPKVDCAQSFVQTEPQDPVIMKTSSIIAEPDDAHHVVEVISQDLM